MSAVRSVTTHWQGDIDLDGGTNPGHMYPGSKDQKNSTSLTKRDTLQKINGSDTICIALRCVLLAPCSELMTHFLAGHSEKLPLPPLGDRLPLSSSVRVAGENQALRHPCRLILLRVISESNGAPRVV
jgi:hypothetical protein